MRFVGQLNWSSASRGLLTDDPWSNLAWTWLDGNSVSRGRFPMVLEGTVAFSYHE